MLTNLFASILAVVIVALGELFVASGSEPLGAPWTIPAVVVTPFLTALVGTLLARHAERRVAPADLLRARLLLLRGRLLLTALALVLFALPVLLGDWIGQARAWIPGQVPAVSHLLMVVPYLLAMVAGQLSLAEAERRLGAQLTGTSQRSAQGWLGRAALEARPVLLPLVPYLVLSGVIDLGWYFPELALRLATDPLLAGAALLGLLVAVLTLSPFLIRYLFPSFSLPPGPLRTRFEELNARAGLRVRDIRVWETGGRDLINACIAGAFGPVRYIFFTDGILRHLDARSLDAVYAHELGHARHHHFLIFFGVVIAFIFGLQWAQTFLVADGLLFIGAAALGGLLYFRGGFGVLSRQLESQADLFSAELVGSTAETARALERVGDLTGGHARHRGWRHHSIPKRIEILLRSELDAGFLARFRRRTGTYVTVATTAFVVGVAGLVTCLHHEAQRPEHVKEYELARLLLEDYRAGLDRPLRSAEREELLLRRAEEHLLATYRSVRSRDASAAVAGELEWQTLRDLDAVYGALGEVWNGAWVRYQLLKLSGDGTWGNPAPHAPTRRGDGPSGL